MRYIPPIQNWSELCVIWFDKRISLHSFSNISFGKSFALHSSTGTIYRYKGVCERRVKPSRYDIIEFERQINLFLWHSDFGRKLPLWREDMGDRRWTQASLWLLSTILMLHNKCIQCRVHHLIQLPLFVRPKVQVISKTIDTRHKQSSTRWAVEARDMNEIYIGVRQ